MAISLDFNSRSLSELNSETEPLVYRRSTSFSHSSRSYCTSSPLSSSWRSTSLFSCAIVCILMTELCERLTYYGISGNLLLFGKEESQLNLTALEASVLSYVFQGTCYTIPLLGGWLADTVAGKFSVIFVGIVIYLFGTVLLPIGAISQSDKHVSWAHSTLLTNTTFKRAVYISGLFLVAFATGAIKANVSPFGADQLSNRAPNAVQAFFTWFYWFITIGSCIAFTFVVYVQQECSYFYGYLIPAISIIVTLFIFLGGKGYYQTRPPAGSVMSRSLKIVKEAIQRSRRPDLGGSLIHHWLDRSEACFGGSYTRAEVEDVKKVLRVIPVFATFILYWTAYAQMSTAVMYQGDYMDIRLTSNFKMPVASLSLLDTIVLLVLIPVMDKLVYPLLAKYNIHLSQLQRMGIGMIVMTMTMLCAGLLELYRVDQCCMRQDRVHSGSVNVSHISILYQIPQYTLLGLSELFATVTALELAYTEAPKSLQGVVMGILTLTSGLGTFAGVVVIAVVNSISGKSSSEDKWYPDKNYINEGKLANYFFLLAGLTFLNFLLYIFVAVRFKAKTDASNRTVNTTEAIDSTSRPRPKSEDMSRC